MKRSILWLFFFMLTFFAPTVLAEEAGVVFLDSFNGQELPSYYEINLWERVSGGCIISVARDEEQGNVLSIVSEDIADAFVIQEISVKPDTLYRLTAKCKAEINDPKQEGASIWVADTYAHSPRILSTNGEWTTLTLYGRTGETQKRLRAGLRFGGTASSNSGWALFDDFCLTEITTVPEGCEVHSFSSGNTQENTEASYANRVDNSEFAQTLDSWEPLTDSETNTVSFACEDSNGYVLLENQTLGWSVLQQTVPCEPNTVYLVSALCQATGVTENGKGACITIGGISAASQSLHETAGSWKELSFYYQTASDQKEMTIELRLGSRSGLNMGKAAFDHINVRRVRNVSGSVQIQKAEVSGENSSLRYEFMYLYIFAAYVLLCVCVFRGIRKHGIRAAAARTSTIKKMAAILPVILGALAFQSYLAWNLNATMCDMQWWGQWADEIYKVGIMRFYQTTAFCDYPPLYLWLLWPIGAIRALVPTISWHANALLLRSIPILCNMGCLLIFWRMASKKYALGAAAGLTAIVAFEPCLILESTGFGRTDSLLTMLILISAMCAENRKYCRALIFFGLALLVKPQALLFAPVGLAFITIRIAEDIRERKDSSSLRHALTGIGVLAVMFYITGFICSYEPGQSLADCLLKPCTWMFNQYTGTMLSYHFQTYNALNLYYLMGLNLCATQVHMDILIASYAAMALVYLFSLIILMKSKRSGSLILTGSAVITLLFCFAPLMHERYGIPSLMLLFVSACMLNDQRPMHAAVVSSFVFFMNLCVTLYSNYNWTAFVFAALVCLNALYIAWMTFDLLARQKNARGPIGTGSKVPPTEQAIPLEAEE